jgi:hypothetical protein
VVSSAFNFVNVPSAAWIDEQGCIVRIDEGTYSKVHELGVGDQTISFGTDVYEPALKDWVVNGAQTNMWNLLLRLWATFASIRRISKKQMQRFAWVICFEGTVWAIRLMFTGKWLPS